MFVHYSANSSLATSSETLDFNKTPGSIFFNYIYTCHYSFK